MSDGHRNVVIRLHFFSCVKSEVSTLTIKVCPIIVLQLIEKVTFIVTAFVFNVYGARSKSPDRNPRSQPPSLLPYVGQLGGLDQSIQKRLL